MQREEVRLRQERDRAKQVELAAQAAADAEQAAAEQAATGILGADDFARFEVARRPGRFAVSPEVHLYCGCKP